MKAINVRILILLITSGLVVACSTARKTVKTENELTQILEAKTDTSSLTATKVSNDSTTTSSWEEIVIEWGADSTRIQSIIDAEATELEKTIAAIRNSGAVKATLKKGQMTTATNVTKESIVETKQSTAVQDKQVQKKTKEKTKTTQRPGWWFVMMYVLAMLVGVALVFGVKYILKKVL